MTGFMRTLAFLLLFPARDPFASEPRAFDPHIRSMEPELLDAVADGVRVSPTLRSLVDRLDASDVVVYLTFDRSPSPHTSGHLSLTSAVAGRRYLRVSIDRRLVGCQRTIILGHELHHAVEIADSRAVTDEAALIALYRRIGFASTGNPHRDAFESVGAILAGRMVEQELREAGRASGSVTRNLHRDRPRGDPR